jgi:hypothetical protein
MSNTTKLVAALSVAGTMLASSPASYAQDLRRGVYASGAYASAVYGDCYYDPSQICPPGPYAAMRPVGPYAAYAAVNGYVQPMFWRGLRGGDWVAIHGAAR